jgi:hypothetical protein
MIMVQMHTHIRTHAHTCIYIYIYFTCLNMCTHTYVCIWHSSISSGSSSIIAMEIHTHRTHTQQYA